MPISRRDFVGAPLLAAVTAALPTRAAGAKPASAGKRVSAADAAGRAARAAVEAGACPGVALQVAQRGRTLFARQVGLANLETGTRVGPDSIFRVGSLTKQFTAALVLKLAADGKLKLDDPVHRYLPFFPSDRPFTVLELAHHTAGLRDDDTDAAASGDESSPTQLDLAKAIGRQQTFFDFPPGTAWRYSNANYIVLGALVEKVADQSLAEAAAALIFRPLGLERTAFDTSAAVVRGRVDGYTRVDGAPGTFTHAPYLDVARAGGAGAMRSCTDDLCRWHHALFANRLFDARWTSLMTTPGRLRDGRVSGSQRFSPEDASYGDVQYGMGLLLPPPDDKGRTVQHYGFINGFSALLETRLDQALTTAILCNADPGPGLPFRAIREVSGHL
ncbi:MAG: beta-lactamase family protein [Deltaproteobacteria bacterium]|nr:beta-lactamase family protein [Deltaproteobacteria bacterium]